MSGYSIAQCSIHGMTEHGPVVVGTTSRVCCIKCAFPQPHDTASRVTGRAAQDFVTPPHPLADRLDEHPTLD